MNQHKMQFPEEKAFSESLRNLSAAMQAAVQQSTDLSDRFLAGLEVFRDHYLQQLQATHDLAAMSPVEANFQDLIEKTFLTFQKTVEQILDQERLRREFSDRFIIFVYGKVKSGKSSLGNLVAQYASAKAEFFRFDDANQEAASAGLIDLDGTDGFEVKATEATTAIQGFKLPGLCWIDSPGLHSTNTQNGELSEKYIASADLVLFFAHSDSPARESNLREICEVLNKAGKAMIVVLTRSDFTEEDEVNGEIIRLLKPKTPPRRREQEKNMANEIIKTANGRDELLAEVFSVSKKLADKAHQENNRQAWEDSNIGKLLQTINDVLSKNAQRLKTGAPLTQMRAALEGLLDGREGSHSLRKLRMHLVQTGKNLEQSRRDLADAFKDMRPSLEHDVLEQAEQIFHDLAIKPADKAQRLSQVIDTSLQKHVQSHLLPVLKKAAESMRQEMTIALDQDEFVIKEKFEDITITKSRTKTGSAIGRTIGGAVGALGFFGGPWVGALTMGIGACIGGAIGGAIGSDSGETKTIRIKCGDDALAKLEHMRATLRQQLQNNLSKLHQDMDDKVYNTILTQIDARIRDIDDFKCKMEELIQPKEQA